MTDRKIGRWKKKKRKRRKWTNDARKGWKKKNEEMEKLTEEMTDGKKETMKERTDDTRKWWKSEKMEKMEKLGKMEKMEKMKVGKDETNTDSIKERTQVVFCQRVIILQVWKVVSRNYFQIRKILPLWRCTVVRLSPSSDFSSMLRYLDGDLNSMNSQDEVISARKISSIYT